VDGYAVIIRANITPLLTDAQFAAVAAELGGTASYNGGTSELRYTASTQESDGIAALGKAGTGLARTVRRHAGAAASIREARVLPWEDFENETFRPATPRGGLSGVAEAAELLGVTRQRLADIRKLPAFPRPVAGLKAGPVWDTAEIERFERGWDRRAGRPAKTE
jgi:hypothetical protein